MQGHEQDLQPRESVLLDYRPGNPPNIKSHAWGKKRHHPAERLIFLISLIILCKARCDKCEATESNMKKKYRGVKPCRIYTSCHGTWSTYTRE